jgi:hypothetical protein
LERQINEAQVQINRLEAIWRENSLKDIPDNIKGNQLFQNGQTMERIFNMKTMLQDKLNKLLQFEASSPQLFANISNLKAIVEKGKAQTAGAWNGSSFTLPVDLSWTKTVSEHWQIRTNTMKAKEKAYHEAKIKELENYNIYAWPYEDPLTKEVTIMWFIDKDGVRIFDEELQNYVEKYGKNLEGMYEIVDWKKIYELDLAARRRGDGKNYLNENQLPSGWEGYGKVGAYVDSGYWYASKTGLLDLALLVGLSFAASKSQMKANTSTNVANVMDDLDDIAKKSSGGNPPKTDFGAETPVSGKDWNNYFKDKYGAGNVQWKPSSFEDIITNPQRLYGCTPNEIKSILGDGWSFKSYGSNGLGWEFYSSEGRIFYHAGGGIHGGSYYGYATGPTGRVKIVDDTYIRTPDDKATIIPRDK